MCFRYSFKSHWWFHVPVVMPWICIESWLWVDLPPDSIGKIRQDFSVAKYILKNAFSTDTQPKHNTFPILNGFWYHEVQSENENGWDPSLTVHRVTYSHWKADSKPNSTTLEERNVWSSLLNGYTWGLFREMKILVKGHVHMDIDKPVLSDAKLLVTE